MKRLVHAALVGVAVSVATRADVEFHALGDLPGGDFHSVAFAASADGAVVACEARGPNGNEACRWSLATGLMSLGQPQSTAFGISGDGSTIVGHYQSTFDAEAFRWTAEAGIVGLGALSNGDESFALGVSLDEQTIVGSSQPNYEAFRWTSDGGMQGIGDLPGCCILSYAYGVSGDGSVIVGVGHDGESQPFRWTEATGIQALQLLPGSVGGGARAVSADGTTTVGYSWEQACLWRHNGAAEPLGDLPGGIFDSAAFGVSGDGSIVVGHSVGSDGEVAFVWDEVYRMRDLKRVLEDDYSIDLDGWTLNIGYGVSADGTTIVGAAYNPDGNYEGFVVTGWPTRCSPTDLNWDRSTNLSDLAVLLSHFGECRGDIGYFAPSDIDRRGCVDLPDLAALLAEFGTACE